MRIQNMIKNNDIIAGIDDATKCPCIGSIFIAGVAADEKTVRAWKKAGVKDSKLITRKKREHLAQLIKKTARAFSIHEVTPAMIDNKVINLNAWEMGVVLRILNEIQSAIPIKKVHIDNWEVNKSLFWNRLEQVSRLDFTQLLPNTIFPFIINKELLFSSEIIPAHRADETYTIVGAASILAKTASDFQYDEYKKIYGNFGSGSPADPATRLFVWEHRKNPLPIIRQSWQTYKVLSLLNSIDEDSIYGRALRKKEQNKLTL